MNDLSIGLIQASLSWENRLENLRHLEELIRRIEKPHDLILLPEMFSTGFSMQPEKVSEKFHPEMESLQWMRRMSREIGSCIAGSISVSEGEKYYNRLMWVFPSGELKYYDKRHLFSFAGEDRHYTAGKERLILELKGWRICPLICYDLRFPVWSRNGLKDYGAEYDLLIYVANWPEARREPWMKLLFARAIENQCYVAGLNRVGIDGNGIAYSGDSLVIDPKGNELNVPGDVEGCISFTLNREELDEFRLKFPVLKDADSFKL